MKDTKLSTQMTSMAVPNNGEATHSSFHRLQKTDERIFTHVAGWHSELGDTVLPRLSIAASYSRLWIAISAVVGLTGGKESRRAVLEALTAVAL